MDDESDFPWLTPQDRSTLAELAAAAPLVAAPITTPREAPLVRLVALVLAPAWALIAVAAMALRLVQGRRPLLVLHERVGYRRCPLRVAKIATLCVSGNRRHLAGLVEVASGAPADDVVLPRVDHWLRLTGLDELPQLALVIDGRMRIVGPRPVTAPELDEMEEDGPVAVDQVMPGLLGVWQLLDRDAYTLAQRRALDAWMVDRWSPQLRRRIVVIGLRQALVRLRRRP